MRKIYLVAGLAAACFFASCGTIIHGSKQNVSISSNPSSALVSINGAEIGKTPVTTTLSRKESHQVKIELNGYMPYETQFIRKVDGWIAGNIIFGGIIGLAVDAISGGMYKLTPEQIQSELRDNTSSVKRLKDGVFLTVVLEADPTWEKVDQLVKVN